MANVRALPGGMTTKGSNGGVTSFTMVAPPDLQVGDCMILAGHSDTDSLLSAFIGPDPADGFIRIHLNGNDGDLGGTNMKYWYRFAKAVDIGKTYTITVSSNSAQVMFLIALQDVHPFDVPDALPGGESTDSGTNNVTSIAAPSITPSSDGSLALFFAGCKGGSTDDNWSMPAGVTEVGDATSEGTHYTQAAFGVKTLGSAGVGSGTQTISKSGTARRMSAASLVIRDAPAILPVLEPAIQVHPDYMVTATFDDTDRTQATQFYVDETAYVTHLVCTRPTTGVAKPTHGALYIVGNPEALVELPWPDVGTQTGKLFLELPSPIRVDPGTSYWTASYQPGSAMTGVSGYFTTGAGSNGIHNDYVHFPSKAAAVGQLQSGLQIGPVIAVPNAGSGSGAYYGQDVQIARIQTAVSTTFVGTGERATLIGLSGSKTGTITSVSTRDVPVSLSASKTRSIGQVRELSSCSPVDSSKSWLVGRVFEHEDRTTLGRSRDTQLGRITENSSLARPEYSRDSTFGSAGEASTVIRPSAAKLQTVGTVAEIERAVSLESSRDVRVGVVRAQSHTVGLAGAKSTTLGQVRATEATVSVNGSKSHSVSPVRERAQVIAPARARTQTITRVRGTDRAETLGRSKTQGFGSVTENESNGGLILVKSTELVSVSELARMTALDGDKSFTLGRVRERAEVTRPGAIRSVRLHKIRAQSRLTGLGRSKVTFLGGVWNQSTVRSLDSAMSAEIGRVRGSSRLARPAYVKTSQFGTVATSSRTDTGLAYGKSTTLSRVGEQTRYARPFLGVTTELGLIRETSGQVPLDSDKTHTISRIGEHTRQLIGVRRSYRINSIRATERLVITYDRSFTLDPVVEVATIGAMRSRYDPGTGNVAYHSEDDLRAYHTDERRFRAYHV